MQSNLAFHEVRRYWQVALAAAGMALALWLSAGCVPVQPAAGTVPGEAARAAGSGGASDEAALVWEGVGGAGECRRLAVNEDGSATVSGCDGSNETGGDLPGPAGEWPVLLADFAPFERESEAGTLTFRGRGGFGGEAAERAVEAWAKLSADELAAGRTSAAGRTVLSWWLDEADSEGMCPHLTVLVYGYATAEMAPCEGGDVASSQGSWLSPEEWEEFDALLYSKGELYEGDNYFAGQGAEAMSEEEEAALADWAKRVYERLAAE